MECKDRIHTIERKKSIRFNRNIMECKVITRINFYCSTVVLIETLWNVKIDKPLPVPEQIQVLIETLWNVKIIKEK